MDWSYPLLAACERHPRRTAIRYRGTEVTYAELEDRIARAAAALRAAGLGGRTVAWLAPAAPEAVVVSMALARIGALAVPLNPALTDGELAFLLEDARAEAVLVAAELAGPAHPRRIDLAELDLGDPAAAPDGWAVDDDAPATVMYTSGTTGAPKGVVRTHRANAWNVVNSALASPRAPEDVELFTLPVFGIGLLHFAIPALLGGATLLLDGAFDARRAWDLLEHERATRTFLAPTMLSAMLAIAGHEARDTSALHTIYSAYEFPAPLQQRAIARFGDCFVYMYGLTEAQLTCTRRGDLTRKPGSVGTAMGVARVRVLDEDGRPAPPGATGEIALHGPSAMAGYHERPEETAATLAGGWVRTGDLGRLDEDGDLRYAGRRKEMIKTGGYSVDPREVEDALVALDAVQEAAVVGVPDEHWGEMVVAFVVGDPPPAEDAVRAALRARLAGYKVPKRVLALDALPLNATGKVARAALRERYASDAAAG